MRQCTICGKEIINEDEAYFEDGLWYCCYDHYFIGEIY